jgi:hypothetical protein
MPAFAQEGGIMKTTAMTVSLAAAVLMSCSSNIPEVQITNPADGDTVSAIVDVTATATDKEGVSTVEFYIDDSLHFEADSSPYVYSWSTYGLADSSVHEIYAKAFDGDGNEATSDTISIVVDNHGATAPYNWLKITAGALNGESLSVTNPAITVQANVVINGAVILQALSLCEPSWVTPLAGTASWGTHSTSYWGINSSIPVDTSTQTAVVDLVAPPDTGLYYIYFAWDAQMEYADVMSLTDWTYSGGPVWNDGVDVADWPDSMAQEAIDEGNVESQYMWGDGTYGTRDIPAAAIRVYVIP